MKYLKCFFLIIPSFLLAINCDYCKYEINDSYIKSNNKNYHDLCYEKHIAAKCSFCNKNIDGLYINEDSLKYHENCFYNYIVDKCSICNNPLVDDYLVDLWNNKYHIYHKKKCNSCNRIISDNTSNGGFYINQDRSICGICNKTIVKLNKEINHSKMYVIELLEEVGFSGLSLDIPIQIVNQNTLCSLYSKSNCNNHRGLTHYEYEYNMYSKIINENSKENRIYILDYLPKIEFLSTLAHEYLHVWLNMNNLKFNSSITEGFCQLGSALVYEHNLTNFSKVKLHEMEINEDIDYGIGYHKMKTCLKKYKWEGLIEQILNGQELACFYK